MAPLNVLRRARPPLTLARLTLARLTLAAVSVAAVSVAAGTACSGHGAESPRLGIRNFAFQPAALVVHVGQQVTLTNHDSVLHGFAADDGSFNVGTVASGGSVRVVVAHAGLVRYHCTLHQAMRGVLDVRP